jgi:hypothetical protein
MLDPVTAQSVFSNSHAAPTDELAKLSFHLLGEMEHCEARTDRFKGRDDLIRRG